MNTQEKAPVRAIRIIAVVALMLLLAVPAMAAPNAPTGSNPVSSVTILSPTYATPFFVSFGAPFKVTYQAFNQNADPALGKVEFYIGSTDGIPVLTLLNVNFPMTSPQVQILYAPISDLTFTYLKGAYDVVVCAETYGTTGKKCTNNLQGPPPGDSYNNLWIGDLTTNGFGQDILFTPVGGAESINAGSNYNVTWDFAAINAIFGNPPGGVSGNHIRLELWDATDYGTNNPSAPTIPNDQRQCLGGTNNNPPPPADPPPSNGWGAINPGPYGPFASNQMILRAVYGPMANTGSYLWTVPEMLGSCFHMRLVFTDDANEDPSAWDWTGVQWPWPPINPNPTWGGRFKIIDFDQTAPLVDVTKPVANACVAGTIDLEAIAGDPDSGIDWVQFAVNGTNVPPNPIHAVAATPLQTLFKTTSDTTQAPWNADGSTNTVRAWARNFAGVISWDEVSVKVDNSAPGIDGAGNPIAGSFTWNGPSCSNPYLNKMQTVSVTVLEPNTPVTSVEFFWDPTGPAAPISLGFGVEGPVNVWTFTWDTTLVPGDGTGQLQAKATNCASLSTINTNQCNFTVDNTAPVCANALHRPPSYDGGGAMEPWQIGQERNWLWQAAGAGAVSDANLGPKPIDLWLSWDGQINWLQVNNAPLANTPANPNQEGVYRQRYVNGYPSTNWFGKLVVTDLAGNTCEDISDQFTVFGAENTQPTGPTPPNQVAWTSPLVSPLAGTFPVTGTAWDPETGIWYVEFCWSGDGGTTWTCPVQDFIPDNYPVAGPSNPDLPPPPVAEQPFTFSGNFPTAGLPDGNVLFAVRAYNGVGMPTLSQPAVTLLVDNQPPTAFNMWPRNYQTVVGTYCPFFDALVDNPQPGPNSGIAFTTFEYSANGGPWTAMPGGCLPNLPDSDSTSPATIYAIKGTATDGAGNVMNPPIVHTDIKINTQFPDMAVLPGTGYPIALTVGWNLISLPQVPATSMIAEVLQDLIACNAVDKVYTFDNPTNMWDFKNYVLSTGGMTDIKDGKGYWLLLNSNLTTCPVQVLWNVGIFPPRPPVAPPTYQAFANWNLLGVTANIAAAPPLLTSYFGASGFMINPPGPTAVYGFSGSYYTPLPFGTLTHGAGYWVAYPFPGTGRTIQP